MSGSYHALGSLPNALSWAERGACAGYYDPEVFFSDAALKVEEAKALCRRCPVVSECLAEALRAEVTPRYGISGGLTPDERDALVGEARPQKTGREGVKNRRPRPKPQTRRSPTPVACGTNAGYRKHIRDKTPTCEPCRKAHAREHNRLRHTGTTKAQP